MGTPRYAVFFTPPPESALWRFGTAAVGYDSYLGRVLGAPERGSFARVLPAGLVAEPARYGFHGTLRAPFELNGDRTTAELEATVRSLALSLAPVALGKLDIAMPASFVALIPAAPCAALQCLGGDIVRASEPFRAPLSAVDRARRLATPLTDRQIANLDTWGYPYVFDDFAFHMTLTGHLENSEAERAAADLRALYAPLDEPVLIDAISLLIQPERSKPFRVAGRYRLAG